MRSIRNRATEVIATALALGCLTTAVVVGVALAATFNLQVAKNARVTAFGGPTTHANIVVTSHGRAVYVLSGDSARHAKCVKASGCLAIWPPVTVASAHKLRAASGIKGKLGTWHRNGFLQLTLGGHPLYMFAGDSRRDVAGGQDITSFGGTWHVITVGGTSHTTTTTTSTTSTRTATSTSTTACLYPPCY